MVKQEKDTLYVIAGIGAALIYGGCMGSALKWFKKERGFAAGLMAAGFGGGTALFIPVIASVIKTSGYQTAFIYTGVFQAVVILVVAQFLRHPQPDAALAKASAGPSVIGQHQFTTGEMLRTPTFYLMWVDFRPSAHAWSGVVPRPENGSRTTSTRRE